MQYNQPRRKKMVRKKRLRAAKLIKVMALALALVICFMVVWFAWLKPGSGIPQPTPSTSLAYSPTQTAAELSPFSTAIASITQLPTPSPSPTLVPLPEASACQPGDSGEAVVLLQTMLIDLGFDPGEADGSYGAQLKSAVRNFQIYAGLPVDGIAGEQTATALTQRWQAAQNIQPVGEPPLKGLLIGLDPGHQRHGNPEQEPESPGSSSTKAKVSSGTQGQFTGIPEYVVNLQVALKLKAVLESMGAQVIMTRTTHGVDISNSQRAQMMNEAGVDCWLRIHANYSPDPKNCGMFILVPNEGGLDTDDPSVVENSVSLAEALLESTLTATGAESRGIVERGDQTGFGWSQTPVCNIEMGYMSNEAEDRLLVTEAYQKKIADGLAQGFVSYFSG